MVRSVYWDTCTWLAFLGKESGRYDALQAIWRDAERGEVRIIASTWAIAECVKAPKDCGAKPMDEENETELDALFLSPFVVLRQVDQVVAATARKLVRMHPQCKKPIDGAHLATALLMNADEMHTYDGDDLLHLDGKCKRADGQMLTICVPLNSAPELPMFSPAGLPAPARP